MDTDQGPTPGRCVSVTGVCVWGGGLGDPGGKTSVHAEASRALLIGVQPRGVKGLLESPKGRHFALTTVKLLR